MPICEDLYLAEEDYPYEEDVLQSPHNLKSWCRYLTHAPPQKRVIIYERALRASPGSYKLWHAYLRLRLDAAHDLPVTHAHYQTLYNTFERALATMHKMPRIWIMHLQSLTRQRLITLTRRTFDRALHALPVTQHGLIWEHYLAFASQKFVPLKTSVTVYSRFLKYDPSYVETFIEFLIDSEMWKEAAERLVEVLNDDQFVSTKGKTKHRMWMEFCDLLTRHSLDMSGLVVDAIVREGIRKFRDETGNLWISLGNYYIKRGLFEKARDVYEEGMMKVATVRDFSLVFDAYSKFEESLLSPRISMENIDDFDEDSEDEEGFWLKDDNDLDMELSRYADLIRRRPELVNSVQLRQNPHNVKAWRKRVGIFEGNPTKQILTYAAGVRTVDPTKAVGKPHTLWVGLAKLYESNGDVSNARIVFDKAVQADHKAVDDLASVWCEWVEMELRHDNLKGAIELLQRATCEPSVEVKRRVTDQENEPVQMKLYKSLKLWTFYVDVMESFVDLEWTCSIYDSIINLRIATPQIIISYGMLLQENNCFEESFRVYEKGVKIFKYPHVKDIWIIYLSKFVDRYGGTKVERVRDLFERAVEDAPAESVKPLYLQYAKMEEEYGLAKRAMEVYDKATKAVPINEKLGMYEIYIAKAAHMFGLPKTREIYEQAINGSGLADEDVMAMCLRYAEIEVSLGEIDRARALYKHASQYADPRFDHEVWNKWGEFEVVHGNEDTVLEMGRVKRSVSDSYSRGKIINGVALVRKREEGTSAQNNGALERIKRLRSN